MTGKRERIPELLAPAGSEDALKAALAAGADAVYFGGSAFSNRMRAKNFTDGGLTEAIRRVHEAGAAAHITVNTRVRDREMDDALRLAERILGGAPETRADAVIIADMGLAEEIRKRWPHAVFHASTQTSLGSAADCIELKKRGFSRLVLPRELNREEIAALCAGPLEIEIFIHGAHCVSLSGQCLMSYYCGGRSGNRGECAQPCRLPYRVSLSGTDKGGREKAGSDTPLSLADMCLAGRIADVCGLGVDSLKIEGRLKSAGYVWGVTSVYRRLLDEGRNAEPGEIRELEALFSRGFTDGYFTGRYGTMAGTPAKDDAEKSSGSISPAQIEKLYDRRIRERTAEREAGLKKRLTAECVIRRGEPVSLTLRVMDTPEIFGTATGSLPAEAVGGALDKESAARNLTKLGGTGYDLAPENIRFALDEGLWMPSSALNDLRRRAVEALALRDTEGSAADSDKGEAEKQGTGGFWPYVFPAQTADSQAADSHFADIHWREKPGREDMVLELADASLLDGDPAVVKKILSRFCRVYLPAEQYGQADRKIQEIRSDEDALPELCAVMPAFPLSAEAGEKLLSSLKADGCGRIQAHGIGGAALDGDFIKDLSYRGNVTNGAAAKFYRDAGFSEIGLSPELPAGGIRALAKIGPVSCIAYGRVPVMTLARCVLKEKNRRCRGCGGRRDFRKTGFCRGSLTDRVGAEFPVFGAGDCVNLVYNAVPVWMGDRLGELRGAVLRFMWTVEGPAEMLEVLRRYERGESGVGRRIQ